jgi:ubiquinone/menaquinone biosynthesis C-methylase UbiE
MLLGDSFHPGRTKLTERLGALLGLGAQSCVLDIASGTGTSALFLAERFGCEVVGVDYGSHNVEQSNAAASARGLDKRVSFRIGDAERLPFPDASFDAVICECAFCTFPDKTAAAAEFERVLRSGGAIGLSDLTRGSAFPEELSGLLAWVACIADAQPVDIYAHEASRRGDNGRPEEIGAAGCRYVRYLCDAGFRVERVEPHDEALLEMVNQVLRPPKRWLV